MGLRQAAVAAAAIGLFDAGAAFAEERWWPSKYGADDLRGAVNNLTPEGVKRAAALVKTGKVYALGIPTGPDSPVYGQRTYTAEIVQSPPAGQPPAGDNKVTAHDEKVTTSMGIGTQMDGFGHLGIDHRYYNGLKGEDLRGPRGFTKLDLADVPPIVTRGVLIDMARHFGKPMLEAGQAFNRPEIEAAMKAQGVKIAKGDVVLFHTGWMKMLSVDKARYQTQEPGLGVEGAAWLADQGVVAIGADTIALEHIPFADANRPFEVHQTLLARKGVHILENIATGAMAADGVREFLFVLGQPRFQGTVQVVINPVAIH
ncbi:MAG: cyclase family protein [Phenylobacterium sp.]|uniref:cyclase family protein n=1 Tax=Phenylobacterium sp. TaxID=1871053 RepID=UPI001A52A6CC|nr:cyclase family protein [Phenylobacterium sp.]MBL8556848.1 cyclase family protein [Phenylobacterium sp.]